MIRLLLLPLLLALGCCKPSTPSPSTAPASSAASSPTSAPPAVLDRLRIRNACAYDIWIQQQGMPGAPAVAYVKAGGMVAYDIPKAGLASTRFWPKKCAQPMAGVVGAPPDLLCVIGQSSPPCPKEGCAPPVDSKLEATWGCTMPDKKDCGKTPQGIPMIDTFWNASAVDGYTFPFSITTSGGDKRASCQPVDCSALALASCPTDDDLSNGGKNPTYAHQDEHVKSPSGAFAGCFSTCTKLNYPGWGGDGLNDPAGAIEQMYCCPTPPISAVSCQAGPVPNTKYVKLIHTACKNTTYGYAYDDGLGARTCSGDTALEMTIGPGCPLRWDIWCARKCFAC